MVLLPQRQHGEKEVRCRVDILVRYSLGCLNFDRATSRVLFCEMTSRLRKMSGFGGAEAGSGGLGRETVVEGGGGRGYEFIREAGTQTLWMVILSPPNKLTGPFETMSHLFHDLGIQSNILVSARYSHADSHQKLTPARVFKALKTTIHEHPALSIIGVVQPSRTNEGNHRFWEARLNVIRFADCVEFLEDTVEGDEALARLFERCHGEWFNTRDRTKPWWKVVVKGGLVVFVCHHLVGDGISGHAFQRSFLAALNKQEEDFDTDEDVLEDAKFFPNRGVPLPIYPMELIEEKLSWPHVIFHFLLWHVIRWFVRQKYFFFSDAKYSKSHPTVSNPQTEAERTVSKMQILRTGSKEMEKILEACRRHRVSFTALFHTLVQITLAADIYPNAQLGFSRIAVSIRPLLKVDPGPDVFMNAASQYARKQFLGRYRAAGQKTHSSTHPTTSSKPPLNIDLTWKLASELKAHMNNFIQTRAVLQDFLAGKLLEGDLEDFGSFYGLGLYQNNGFLISNIGTFEPKDGREGEWSVSDVGFSAGQIRAALGDAGIGFTIAGLKGGDCVVVAGYEEGVLEESVVRRVLVGIEGRLKVLV